MKSTLLAATTLPICIFGCAYGGVQPSGPRPAPAIATPFSGPVMAASPAPTPARAPGDYIVYRFSGSFRESPLVLTQQVMSQRGNVVLLDVTLDDAGKKERFRVRVDDLGELLSVARMDGKVQRPFGIAAYESLLARAGRFADENEALLKSEETNIQVGNRAIPCRKSVYLVRVAGELAEMQTLQSDGFPWGDLGGEIRSFDGRVLYRAEIVDAGRSDAVALAPTAPMAPMAVSAPLDAPEE